MGSSINFSNQKMFFKLFVIFIAVLFAYWYRLQEEKVENLFNSADYAEAVKPHEGYQRIENPVPGVYAALYYALANIIILNQNNEWLIVDTTENCDKMNEILKD